MTTVDAQGNIHDRTGQFSRKQNSAPSGGLITSADVPKLGAPMPPVTSEQLRDADRDVDARYGEREIGDDTARTIARHLLENTGRDDLPHLAAFAAGEDFDHGDFDRVDALHRELGSLYEGPDGAGSMHSRYRRIDMMFTWASHGPDAEVPASMKAAAR